eukprot:scaffold29182_cov18-Tisochrysis_lutea.AAC.1
MSNAFDLYLQTAHRLQIPAGVLVLMADGRDSGPLCNGAGCTMSAEIPISMDSYNSSRQLACTRLEPGANSELPLSIAIDEYNPADVRVSSSGTVHCPSTHLGPHIVIQLARLLSASKAQNCIGKGGFSLRRLAIVMDLVTLGFLNLRPRKQSPQLWSQGKVVSKTIGKVIGNMRLVGFNQDDALSRNLNLT